MRFFVSKNLMFLLIMLLILLQPFFVSATINTNNVDTAHICLKATQTVEKQYNIKRHLLTTISSVESGRWHEKSQQKLAWPWTLNAQGKGYFFNTKAEAVQKVRELQAQGVKSIDVGCMQVNLSYHGHEFASIEEAFDPVRNVEYAAKFLNNLYENNNHDWLKAAMAYHSTSPDKASKYRKKIVEAFETVKTAQKDFTSSLRDKKQIAEIKIKPQAEKISLAKAKLVSKARQAQIAKRANKPQLDVKAWREAKLEEYRVQKLMARKY